MPTTNRERPHLDPRRCNDDVFRQGRPLAVIDGKSRSINYLVEGIIRRTTAQLDWHRSGGRGQILVLGTDEERSQAEAILKQIIPRYKVEIIKIFSPNDTGLHRRGATPTPTDAVAGFYEDGEPASTFI